MGLYYSIIVPAYNASKYIKNCIDSVLSQDYINYELIIVDDGSIDETKSIVSDYLFDNRIRYIYQNNSGVSSARNRGIMESKGDYVCFVDADDVISSDFLSVFDSILSKEKIDVIYCGNYDFYDDTLPVFVEGTKVKTHNAYVIDYDYCSSTSHSTVWGVMFSSEIISGIRFRKDIFVAEDSLFFTEVLLRCDRVHYVDSVLYGYRKHSGSVTGTKDYSEKKVTEIYAWREIASLVDEKYNNSTLSISSHAVCGMNAYKGMKIMRRRSYNPELWEYCLNTMREKINYVLNSSVKIHNKLMYCLVCKFPSFGVRIYNIIKRGEHT